MLLYICKIKKERKENMFDDFDIGPQCEEFYDDADYWEAVMNQEDFEDEE